ncbi:MAG: TetR-like C-terminal domain-containing protein, partial [Methanocorpusculum sp.]|nr:TetR-like C-terminal domain-containing protein [Methanocorpusculum sp.]
KIISGYAEGIPDADLNAEYLTSFYLGAMLGILERWLLGEVSLTPEEIVSYTGKIAEAQLTGARVLLGMK